MKDRVSTILVTVALTLIGILGLLQYTDHDAKIGGIEVRDTIICEEDEVIWWTGIDKLGCIHYEEVN